MPLSQAFDMFSSLAAGPEVAITGTVSLTASAFGKMHKISGTSASYTITLPAASGNGGKIIGFRVLDLAAASKLYTLDGNGSETINGSLTRILRDGEWCVLICDGSNWFKIGGASRPMKCKISASASQTGIAAITFTVATLPTATLDDTGLMAGSSIVTIQRPGTYLGTIYAEAQSSGGAADAGAGNALSISLNSTSVERWRLMRSPTDADGITGGSGAAVMEGLVAGDVLRLLMYFGKVSGTPTFATTYSSPGIVANLAAVELTTW